MKKLRLRKTKIAGAIFASALFVTLLGQMAMATGYKSTSVTKSTIAIAKVNQKVTYKVYGNGRFGFSIEYPSTFKVKLIPANDDGRIFASQDGKAELTVSGINNILNETPTSAYNSLLKEHKNASYKKRGGNWFVLSWIEGNKIVYEKQVVGTGSINTFVIKYPLNQNKYYDPIVAHLDASFKTPGIKDCH